MRVAVEATVEASVRVLAQPVAGAAQGTSCRTSVQPGGLADRSGGRWQ